MPRDFRPCRRMPSNPSSPAGKTRVPPSARTTSCSFPDPKNHRILLTDLRQEKSRATLRAIWTGPHSLDPSKKAAEVTRDIAGRLAKSLEAGEHDPRSSPDSSSAASSPCSPKTSACCPRAAPKNLLEIVQASDVQTSYSPSSFRSYLQNNNETIFTRTERGKYLIQEPTAEYKCRDIFKTATTLDSSQGFAFVRLPYRHRKTFGKQLRGLPHEVILRLSTGRRIHDCVPWQGSRRSSEVPPKG